MKPMPTNKQAEINILSSILFKSDNIVKVAMELKVTDFYNTANALIYSSMLSLFSKNEPIELVSLMKEIGKDNLVKIGGPSYITEILETGSNSINIKYNINEIKEKSKRRTLIKLLTTTLTDAYEETNKIDDLISSIQENTLNNNETNKILTDDKLFGKTINEIEKRMSNGGSIPGMKTGLQTFDKATNGLKKGELFILAGRPSMGKTLVALTIADGLGANGYKVGLFEMEMTEEALGMRRLSYLTKIENKDLQKGDLSQEQWDLIANTYTNLSKRNNIFTDCSVNNSILDIKAKAKILKQSGLDVIIIDHLGLLDIKDNGNRTQAISEVTRQCKLMAKELDINVVIVSQLSRACEQRADHRPMLSDLRESGSIEQDADLVVFAYRDEYYNLESEEKGIMEWIIAKQRNGAVGRLKFAYRPEYQLITELDFRKDW